MTTTNDTDEKYVGHAIYIEFHQGTRASINQMLIVSEMVSPADNRLIPMTFSSRQISAESPQRRWSTSRSTAENKTALTHDTDEKGKDVVALSLEGSITFGVQTGVEYFKEFANRMDMVTFGDWVINREPLVTEISAKEAVEIQALKIPRSIIDRIDRMRDALGFEPLPSRI